MSHEVVRMQGRAILEEFGLGADLTWNARQSASFKAKVLEQQGSDGLEIDLARE